MMTDICARCAKVSRDLAVTVLLMAVVSVALQPTMAVAQTRIVAVGDIHGDADALTTILQQAGIIDANRQWIGGNTVLVHTGDMVDRGLKDRDVMDLLMALEQQAPQAGGRVVVLLGNHEVMNLMGDLRYVVNYTPYADAQTEERRKAAYQAYTEWRTRQATDLRQPAPLFTPGMEQQWMEAHLRGFLEREAAFGPNGKYGAWLRTRPAIAQIDSTIFLHGGIAPKFASMHGEALNAQIKREIALFDQSKQYMVERKLILPFFTLDEMTAAAKEALKARTAQTSLTDQEKQDMKVLKEFLDNGTWLSLSPDGPLWFRGFAEWPDEEGAVQMATLRKTFGNVRFVVGHTPQSDGRIHARFGGRVFLIDTGMLSSYFRGRASALEIRNGIFTALYMDQRTVLLDPTTLAQPSDSAPVSRLKATQRVWWDPDGQPLPFNTDEQIMEFLRTARVVSMQDIGEGVTRPRKALLEKDGIRMHAIFRDVSQAVLFVWG